MVNFDYKKLLKKDNLLILILGGVLLLIISFPTKSYDKASSSQTFVTTEGKADNESMALSRDYEEEIEEKIYRIIASMEGVGECSVSVMAKSSPEDGTFSAKLSMPEVVGVVVVARGADNGTVNKDITDTITALLGIESHRIKVVKMK